MEVAAPVNADSPRHKAVKVAACLRISFSKVLTIVVKRARIVVLPCDDCPPLNTWLRPPLLRGRRA